jgi:hypothetical protein
METVLFPMAAPRRKHRAGTTGRGPSSPSTLHQHAGFIFSVTTAPSIATKGSGFIRRKPDKPVNAAKVLGGSDFPRSVIELRRCQNSGRKSGPF